MVPWDTRRLSSWGFSVFSLRRSVPATNPTTAYSQRSAAAAHGGRAGRVSAATPTSRLGHPLRWHDMQNGHHAGPLPDSPSTRRVPDAGRSYEALHPKRFLARYPLAPAVRVLGASVDELSEQPSVKRHHAV